MPDIDDLITGPNAGAFEKEEIRKGAPLSYVVEKLRDAVECAHDTFNSIQRDVPDNLPQPPKTVGTPYSIKQDGLLTPAYSTFRYSLVAFLALHNMLGMIPDQNKIQGLLNLPHDDFIEWLNRVEREGPILG